MRRVKVDGIRDSFHILLALDDSLRSEDIVRDHPPNRVVLLSNHCAWRQVAVNIRRRLSNNNNTRLLGGRGSSNDLREERISLTN